MMIGIAAKINGRFVSAEYGGGRDDNALTANRDELKGYETFEEIKLSNGGFALRTHTGNYVTADINGQMRTNATEVGAWENFWWEDGYILTVHGKYLTARIDKKDVPIESTDKKEAWEEFSRIALESEIPLGRPELDTPHRIGCSVANIFMANHYDYKRYANMLGDNRIDLTGINLTSAHWPDMAEEKGTYPHVKLANGQWDLHNFNQQYIEKLADVISAFHANDVHVILTLLNLYDWSNRKKDDGVPDANQYHWRNNPQGVKWVVNIMVIGKRMTRH